MKEYVPKRFFRVFEAVFHTKETRRDRFRGEIKLIICRIKLNIYIYNCIDAPATLISPFYHPGRPFPRRPRQ